MDELWIFGDSFAANHWPVETQGFNWVNEIANKYSVLNLAKIGTGPDYSLDCLRRKFLTTPKDKTKDITVIFFSADSFRLNLSCYKDPMQSAEIYALAEGKINHKAKLFAKQLVEWYLDHNYKERCDLQYLATLNHMSQYFKQVLYWPVPTLTPTTENFLDVADNMFVPNQSLVDISVEDCGHQIIGLNIDPRANHLHEENHRIMYDQLVDWIENFSPIDTSKFKFVAPLETK